MFQRRSLSIARSTCLNILQLPIWKEHITYLHYYWIREKTAENSTSSNIIYFAFLCLSTFLISNSNTMDRLEQGTRLEILNPDKKFEVKEEIQDVSLPPCDRGRGAWVFLSAASVTITMTWGMDENYRYIFETKSMAGFSSAFGVFREYYFHYGRFKGEQSISQIGVLGLVGP